MNCFNWFNPSYDSWFSRFFFLRQHTWAAIGAAAVSVVGGAVVANNSKPKSPGTRDLSGELANIGSQYPEILGNFLGGNQSFTNSSLGNFGTLTHGNPYIDSTPYYNGLSAEDKANIDAEAAKQGISGVEWLNGHFLDQAGKGDQTAQAAFNQYGGYSGGLLDYEQNLNTATRTHNLQDAINYAPAYTALTRGANQNYYNALDNFTGATQQSVQPGAAQQQAGQRAAQGFGSFDPSGLYANTNYTSQFVQAPGGSPLLTQLNQQAQNAGPSGLQQQQNEIGQQLLAQGGQLSASELRNVQQASRSGFAARGLDATNASVVDEALQTDAAQRARLTQNLGLAQGIQNQGLAEQGQQQQFGLGVNNANLGYGSLGVQAQQYNQAANLQAQNLGLQSQQANQNFGLGSFASNLQSQQLQQQSLQQAALLQEQQRQAQLQAQAQAVQLQRQGYLDPFAAIIGSADTNLLGQILGANQANQGTQASLYGGLLGYGQDLNNTNYNAGAAANIAGYNANQNLYGSLISAGSNLGSAYLANRNANTGTTPTYSSVPVSGVDISTSMAGGVCWIAREVFGEDDPRWKQFRHWLMIYAPIWFFNFYLEYGQRIAAWLHRHPFLKPIIRRWMVGRIKTIYAHAL